MSKNKWMIVAGAVALIVVVLVAAAFLLPRSSSSPGTGNEGQASIVTSSTTIAETPSSPTSSSTTTGSVTKPAPVSSPVPNATPGTAPTTSGVNPALSPLKPFPPLPDPNVPARTVTTPEAAGKILAPLTDAPDPTISGLKLGSVPDGARYEIRMRPYGIGPSLILGSRLAILVVSATPAHGTPVHKGIVNANILALVDTTHGGAVTKGGTYTARLTFRSDGSKLIPIMSDVKAAK
jgi:hypothetical protein